MTSSSSSLPGLPAGENLVQTSKIGFTGVFKIGLLIFSIPLRASSYPSGSWELIGVFFPFLFSFLDIHSRRSLGGWASCPFSLSLSVPKIFGGRTLHASRETFFPISFISLYHISSSSSSSKKQVRNLFLLPFSFCDIFWINSFGTLKSRKEEDDAFFFWEDCLVYTSLPSYFLLRSCYTYVAGTSMCTCVYFMMYPSHALLSSSSTSSICLWNDLDIVYGDGLRICPIRIKLTIQCDYVKKQPYLSDPAPTEDK